MFIPSGKSSMMLHVRVKTSVPNLKLLISDPDPQNETQEFRWILDPDPSEN